MSAPGTLNAPDGQDLDAGIDPSTIPEGGLLKVCWRGKPVLLANDRGNICAVSGTCTHMDAPLNEGILVDGEVHCPWHHARFSLTTGQAVGAPAFGPLTRFRTTIRDGRLFVIDAPTPSPSSHPSGANARVVIVGGGAGGHACAQYLVQAGFRGSVTIISDDPDPPYDRTVCSKQYLIGMQSRDKSLLNDGDIYQAGAGHPTLRLGCRVQALETAQRLLLLDDGERLPFDQLVLAMGAEPKRPPTPGFDLPNVYVLRTLRDADALIRAAEKAQRVAVIGASFIGLEVAASLRQRKLEVHVVTPESIVLEKLLGPEVGRMIQGVHEEQGVRFHFGREVRRFDGEQLALDDGTTFGADFVVLGVGVTPRTELAQAAGIRCAPEKEGGGVIVNGKLESSCPGVFAIGDIAHYPDPHSGRNIRVEHWVHAQRQGQHVARVMLNQARDYADVPFFWSAHFDTGLRYLGHVGKIIDCETQGSVVERNFSRRYRGSGKEQAFVTCNRDLKSLREEANWDHAVRR